MKWIVVKFCGKKTVRRFAGTVVESRNSSDELTVKFARRLDERRFKWPEKDDIADVDPDQVEAVLNPPICYFKNDRITSFEFKQKFEYIVEYQIYCSSID